MKMIDFCFHSLNLLLKLYPLLLFSAWIGVVQTYF